MRFALALLTAGVLAAGCGSSDTPGAEGADATAVAQSATAGVAAPTPTEALASSSPSVGTSPVDCLVVEASVPSLDKSWSEFSGDGNGVFVAVSLELTNLCEKPIKAYAGTVEVFDTFGDSIFKGNWKQTRKIAVGASTTSKTGQGYGFSEFEDAVVPLKDAAREDLTITFTPTMLVFADGTRVEG